MQISNGFRDPFANSPFVKLDYVLKGIRRCQACCGYGSSRQRFPIIPEILHAIRALWKINWVILKCYGQLFVWVSLVS